MKFNQSLQNRFDEMIRFKKKIKDKNKNEKNTIM